MGRTTTQRATRPKIRCTPTGHHVSSFGSIGGTAARSDFAATLNDLDQSLKGLVRRAMTESGLTASERAAITLQSSKLDQPIRRSWMPVTNITDEVIENTLNRVVQSQRDCHGRSAWRRAEEACVGTSQCYGKYET